MDLERDSTECALCAHQYDQVDRLPMVLCTSAHCACRICWERLSSGSSPVCPFCRGTLLSITKTLVHRGAVTRINRRMFKEQEHYFCEGISCGKCFMRLQDIRVMFVCTCRVSYACAEGALTRPMIREGLRCEGCSTTHARKCRRGALTHFAFFYFIEEAAFEESLKFLKFRCSSEPELVGAVLLTSQKYQQQMKKTNIDFSSFKHEMEGILNSPLAQRILQATGKESSEILAFFSILVELTFEVYKNRVNVNGDLNDLFEILYGVYEAGKTRSPQQIEQLLSLRINQRLKTVIAGLLDTEELSVVVNVANFAEVFPLQFEIWTNFVHEVYKNYKRLPLDIKAKIKTVNKRFANRKMEQRESKNTTRNAWQ